MRRINTKSYVLAVIVRNITHFTISWMCTWQWKTVASGMNSSRKGSIRAMACMMLLVFSGCTVTHSLKEIPQELEAVAELKPSLEQVAALDPTLKTVAALDVPLKNVAELKPSMEQVAALDPTLKTVAALDVPLKNVAELKPSLEQVAALDPTLKTVAALDIPLKDVAELKTPLEALGAMATITQPTTYIPMFGFVGVVLFLAIWGGIKMGRH